MYLTEKKITKRSTDYKEIEAFMKRVFPKEELMSMWLINLMTMKKSNKFSAFYDNDIFVGIQFTMEKKDMLFVFYFAVNDEIQSKGYGSKLLQMLVEKHYGKPISLFIETLDPLAANYQQRVKRLAFYERNGFVNTGIKSGFIRPFIDILSTDKNFNIRQCKKMVRFTPMRIFPPVTNENMQDL